jgi:hypothetical protein
MQAPSGQVTATALQALLKDGVHSNHHGGQFST